MKIKYYWVPAIVSYHNGILQAEIHNLKGEDHIAGKAMQPYWKQKRSNLVAWQTKIWMQ